MNMCAFASIVIMLASRLPFESEVVCEKRDSNQNVTQVKARTSTTSVSVLLCSWQCMTCAVLGQVQPASAACAQQMIEQIRHGDTVSPLHMTVLMQDISFLSE